MINLSSFQSLLQFFAAIYLVVEWVNVERIVDHYKNRQKTELGFRIRLFKEYNDELQEIWNEMEDEKCPLVNTYDLYKSYSFFRRVCLVFFVICFFGLVYTSFYSDEQVSRLTLLTIVLFLCSPFTYVFYRLILSVRNEYKLNKKLIEQILVPIEKASEKFRAENPYPQRRDAIIKRQQGDDNAMKVHRINVKKYQDNYVNYMKNLLQSS